MKFLSTRVLATPLRRRLSATLGPGLLVMLADTDAGSIITAAQSGAQWGYKLLILQLVLIPILFVVQELTVRLGLATQQGHGELIRATFGKGWAWLSVGTLCVACIGALLTQLSGIAGIAQLFGVPVVPAIAVTIAAVSPPSTSMPVSPSTIASDAPESTPPTAARPAMPASR